MKVEIHITAQATDADGTADTTQTVCGFLRKLDTALEIAYRENGGEESLGNTRTSLRIFDDHAELFRQGEYGGVLIMEPGCTHTCDYTTPFGVLPLEVTASAMHSTVTQNGTGSLSLCYDLAAGGTPTHHELHLTVSPL